MEGRITRSKAAKQQTSMPSSKSVKSTTATPVTIFADENNPNAFIHPNKRISSSQSSSSHVVVKKQSNLHHSTTLRLETKKMEISESELSMNGAPEGDLYDVQILNDTELFAFDSPEMAEAAFQTACSLKKDSSSWADLFSVVEVIRRLALHHQKELLSSDLLGEGVDSAIEAVISLRSSTIRNGILCLKALAAIDKMNSEYICRIVATLMGRTSGGPRFICDTATSAVEETIALLPPQLSIDALTSSTLLKNSDSAGKAFVLIAQSVIRLYSPTSTTDNSTTYDCMSSSSSAVAAVPTAVGSGKQSTDDGIANMLGENQVISGKMDENKSYGGHDDLLRLLSRGLSARTPTARESSRLALKRMKLYVGQEVSIYFSFFVVLLLSLLCVILLISHLTLSHLPHTLLHTLYHQNHTGLCDCSKRNVTGTIGKGSTSRGGGSKQTCWSINEQHQVPLTSHNYICIPLHIIIYVKFNHLLSRL